MYQCKMFVTQQVLHEFTTARHEIRNHRAQQVVCVLYGMRRYQCYCREWYARLARKQNSNYYNKFRNVTLSTKLAQQKEV